ncbi:MAG: hypothetical protein Q9157_002536 [Trypethelium eluteriae]
MSSHAATFPNGASAFTLSSRDSRPLRSHDIGDSSPRKGKRPPSLKTIRAKEPTTTDSTLEDTKSVHNSRDDDASIEADDEDEDEDDGDSDPDQEVDEEPEVNAPLHSNNLDQAYTNLSRAQTATAGLQNALQFVAEQEHGTGFRHDSLPNHLQSSSGKKRTFSQLARSIPSEYDSSNPLDDGETPCKKVREDAVSNDSTIAHAISHTENVNDDGYDEDIEMLQRATQCEDDDAFVDDDNYDGLDAISDTDEARHIRLIETLDIEAASAASESDFDSDLDIHKALPRPDTIFDFLGTDLTGIANLEGSSNAPLSSQADDHQSHPRKDSTGSARKVRFEDQVQVSSKASSTSSSEIRRDYPDILLSQDNLDVPPFPRGPLGANDPFRGFPSPVGSDGSFWDVTDGTYQPANAHRSDAPGKSPGSSGYESDTSTDDGETTEEDTFVLETISRPRSLLHESLSPSRRQQRANRQMTHTAGSPGSGSESESSARPPPKLPPRGTFRVSIHQRVAMTDWTGQKTLMYNMGEPKCSCNSDLNCISGKLKQNPDVFMPFPQTPNTPAESMNMTFNNLVEDESNVAVPNQPVGPFEAFFPFYSVEPDGTVTQDQLDSLDLDGFELDDGEMDIDINNFISYSDENSDYEEMETEFAVESPSTSEQEQAEADRLASSDAWFEGYDSNTITSFRRNSDRAQQVSRMPEHPSLRSAADLANAYRQGHDSVGDSLITPPRRRRSDRGLDPSPYPLTASSARSAYGDRVAGPAHVLLSPATTHLAFIYDFTSYGSRYRLNDSEDFHSGEAPNLAQKSGLFEF